MITINLLPQSLKQERVNKIRKIKLYSGFIASWIILISIMVIVEIFNQGLALVKNENEQKLNDLKQTLQEKQGVESLALRIQDIAKNLQKLEKNQILWSKILNELARNCPSGIQIESFEASKETNPQIKLAGKAKSLIDIIVFKDSLEKSEYFTHVNFVSSEYNSEQKNIKYSLTLSLEKQR